jgi:hypothetical protein
MCGCALKASFASTTARSTMRAKPAVVKGEPGSEREDEEAKNRFWNYRRDFACSAIMTQEPRRRSQAMSAAPKAQAPLQS